MRSRLLAAAVCGGFVALVALISVVGAANAAATDPPNIVTIDGTKINVCLYAHLGDILKVNTQIADDIRKNLSDKDFTALKAGHCHPGPSGVTLGSATNSADCVTAKADLVTAETARITASRHLTTLKAAATATSGPGGVKVTTAEQAAVTDARASLTARKVDVSAAQDRRDTACGVVKVKVGGTSTGTGVITELPVGAPETGGGPR